MINGWKLPSNREISCIIIGMCMQNWLLLMSAQRFLCKFQNLNLMMQTSVSFLMKGFCFCKCLSHIKSWRVINEVQIKTGGWAEKYKITQVPSSPICSCRRFRCWPIPHWPWWCMSQRPACCRRAARAEVSTRKVTTKNTTIQRSPEKKSLGLGLSCWRVWQRGRTWWRNPPQHCAESPRETERRWKEMRTFWYSLNLH